MFTDIEKAREFEVELDIYQEGQNAAGADDFKIFWSDTRCIYWGWLYRENRVFADFSASDLVMIEKWLKSLGFPLKG